MRINLHLPRLRLVALVCWVLGAICLLSGSRLGLQAPSMRLLVLSLVLLGVLAFALGLAFWLLAGDRRASITLDAKGLTLNLGHSTSFITWENIERTGVSYRWQGLLDLGSVRQLGIALRDPRPYVQSYEERLPAARGPLAVATRLLQRALRREVRVRDRPLLHRLEANRRWSGYDVLIPEAFIGGSAKGLAELIEGYRASPSDRRALSSVPA